jgi:hypothetical protein
MVHNKIKFYAHPKTGLQTTVFELWDRDFNRYFKGVAVCRAEDSFDKGVGIRIARQKAVLKMRSWKARNCQIALDKIALMKEIEPKLIEQHKYWQDKAEKAFATLVNTLKENGLDTTNIKDNE